MVVSFFALLAALFILADALLVWFLGWLVENGLFWTFTAMVGVVILMANLYK
jgi:hypothetical protein